MSVVFALIILYSTGVLASYLIANWLFDKQFPDDK